MSAQPAYQAQARPIVTAVVVAHNGAQWFSELIAGLRNQHRAPDRVVAVDTGSRDGSRDQLVATFGAGRVLDAPRETGFGAAVARAVRALPTRQPGEWLWLLHDDCAPAPGALDALLRLGDMVPSAAILGPKLRDWPDGRRLLELGVTIAGSGNRETGLEFGEFDQGQHDVVRDVLAVSTAGMLIRRDVFERLGGFDERFGLFRDDIDLGWRVVRAGYRVLACPDAVVFHAEAGLRGMRRLHAVSGRPRRVDRRNAIYTLLVNCALWTLPFVALRLAGGSVLRVLALLVAKWPTAAYDELVAMLAVFSRPDLIVTGRRRRAQFRRVSRHAIRRLLPPPWIGIQHTVEALAAVVSARSGAHAGTSRRARSPVETGPVAEEAEELGSAASGVWRWLLTRPPALVFIGLIVVAGVACRDLFGAGALGGGALLPAPDSVVDLWRRYVESWHPVDLGSGRSAPPYITVVAALGTLLAGKTWLAVDVLLLGCVPLAGLTFFILVRSIVRARLLRLWAVATYALLPAVTGAVAGGRLGTCVAIVILPLLVLAAVRTVGAGRPGVGSWSAAWTSGLVLAVLGAFVPLGYVVALLLGVGLAATPWLHPGARLRVGLALAIPPVLLLPWLPVFLHDPLALLGEAGLSSPELADSRLAPTTLLLGSPGGPGSAPAWMYGLLLLVALPALLRGDQGRGVLAGWALSVTGLALGLAQSRIALQVDWIGAPVPSWPGFAAVLVVTGWILATAHAADGASQLFSQRSFSWQQPVAGLLAVVAVGAPLLAAGWWVIRGADGPLARDAGSAVPPYIREAQGTSAHPRALVIQADAGTVRYAVLRGAAARLGDAEVAGGSETLAPLGASIGDLLSDAQHDDSAGRLASFAIGYIYVPAPADARTVERLDTTPGLTRASAPDGAAAWQVDAPAGLLRVEPVGSAGGGETVSVPAGTELLDVPGEGAAITVPDGPAGRRLVLAESFDAGWQARLSGKPLQPSRHAGWAQSFTLPDSGGRLVLSHAPGAHGELLAVQAGLAVLFLIFALPTQARRESVPTAAPVRRQDEGASGPDARSARHTPTPGDPVGANGSAPHERARR